MAALNDRAVITSSTFGTPRSGQVGKVILNAKNLEVLEGSRIKTTSDSDTGGANIVIRASQTVTVGNGGQLIASSELFPAGNILVHSGLDIAILSASASAGSDSDGGSVKLQSPLVVLQSSSLMANSSSQGGNIEIGGGLFLKFNSTLMATGATQGTISIDSPDPDIAGAIIALRPESIGNSLGLEPTCAQMFAGAFSSFVQVGVGGLPPEPGGFQPPTEAPNNGRP
jgi:hypothetical protein